MTQITRTTDGLVLRDNFNRANNAAVGNGWEESIPADSEILSNAVFISPRSTIQRETPVQPDDLIIQINFTGSQQVSLAARRDVVANDYYSLDLGSTTWRLHKTVGGSFPITAEFTESINGLHGIRLVLEEDGADVLVSFYTAIDIASLVALDDDFTLRVSFVDTSPLPNDAGVEYFFSKAINSGAATFDEFILCGRNIVVSGLPTGWKIKVDARTAVVESSGSVTINVDTWALPATTIKVLNGADVEQATLTPSGGIFGGDIFLSALTGEVQFDASIEVVLPSLGEIQFAASVEVQQNGNVQAVASMEVAQNGVVQVIASVEVEAGGEVQFAASMEVVLVSDGEVQFDASVEVEQHGVVQFDASIEVAQRGVVQVTASMEVLVLLSRTTDGLVLRDQFNRANNVAVGNGWIEITPANAELASNQLKWTGGTNVRRQTPAQPDELIIQINFNGFTSVIGARSENAVAGYNLEKFSGTWFLRKYVGGSIVQSDTLSETTSDWNTHRLVLEPSGDDLLVRAYAALAIADGADLSNDVSLKMSFTDTSPVVNSSPTDGMLLAMVTPSVDSFGDEFFLCGRNVVVSGLKTGQKVQIDSHTAVSESGGSVTIDVDTFALPATDIKILSSSDVELTTLTPSAGIWGGDVYVADVENPPAGEVQFVASMEVEQHGVVQITASIETMFSGKVQIIASMEVMFVGQEQSDASIEAAQQNEVQVDASLAVFVKIDGEVQSDASVEAAQNGAVQITASIGVMAEIPGEIQIDVFVEAAFQFHVQIDASTEVKQHGVKQIDVSEIVAQSGIIQFNASMEADLTRFTEPFPLGRNDFLISTSARASRIRKRIRRRP